MLGPLRAPLRRLIAAWTEVRLAEPAPDALGLDPRLPTLYVLPRPALSDALLLENYTRRHSLPSAEGREQGTRRCLSLPARRFRWWPGRPLPVAPFTDLIAAGEEVQLVPVSVFWGRAPGKDFGLWHLLAADSWQLTGRLRRALSVLVNGRDVELHMGAPLRLSELIDGRDSALTNRKMARLLRVHFRRVRTRVLGPDLSHRSTLIQGVVASPEVRRVIQDIQASSPGASAARSEARLKRRARRYGNEIASNMTYPVQRFLAGALKRLWNRLYDGVDVTGLDRVKALAGDHTLVYVPCHRSHIDYLLLSYVLYRDGLMPPHIAAGRNLDMPVIGPLLRRGGAFFLRRSFRDNRLYGAVFNEYLHRLLAGGYPMEYFIEGGRSRNGRMLPARPGMLAMTLRSFLRLQRSGTQPMVFVPVYIGYERILENASYQRELEGGRKRKETPLGLVKVLGRLRDPFGRVSLNFGDPLPVAEFLDTHHPGWQAGSDGDTGHAWLKPLVPQLGDALASRINAVAALNPVNLVAMALLATPHRALEEDALKAQLALLVRLANSASSEGPRPTCPQGSPQEWIERVIELEMIQRRPQALGDIVLADSTQAALLGWYRNNVLHVFALPALVAFAFRQTRERDLDSLHEQLAPLWPTLARELSLARPTDLREDLARVLAALDDADLLETSNGGWRPKEHLMAEERLRLLGQIIQPSLERNYLLLDVLLGAESGSLGRESLCARAKGLVERLALLTGREAPEFFDGRLFETLVDSLIAEGWVWQHGDVLAFDDRLRQSARRVSRLLDPSLRQRLAMLTRHADIRA